MEIIKVISILISFILIMFGVIMIFDARKLAKKWFSFHEQNKVTKGLKVIGFIVSILSLSILYFM